MSKNLMQDMKNKSNNVLYLKYREIITQNLFNKLKKESTANSSFNDSNSFIYKNKNVDINNNLKKIENASIPKIKKIKNKFISLFKKEEDSSLNTKIKEYLKNKYFKKIRGSQNLSNNLNISNSSKIIYKLGNKNLNQNKNLYSFNNIMLKNDKFNENLDLIKPKKNYYSLSQSFNNTKGDSSKEVIKSRITLKNIRLKNLKRKFKLYSQSLKNLDVKEYESNKKKNLINKELYSNNNLLRIIKLNLINNNFFDIENDFICEYNNKYINNFGKDLIIKTNKTLKGYLPKNCKRNFSHNTISKFKSLLGNF